MSRKFKLLIVVSLLLNVLLIGVFIGHWSHRMWGGKFRGHVSVEQFSPDVKAAISDVREKNRVLHKKARLVRQETFNILQAEPFDVEAYQHQVSQIHELRGQMMQNYADLVKKAGGELSPEQRVDLVKSLRRYGKKRFKRRP